jgi:hypothetical protein
VRGEAAVVPGVVECFGWVRASLRGIRRGAGSALSMRRSIARPSTSTNRVRAYVSAQQPCPDGGWPELGWCHACGTLQRFCDAPWLPVRWVFKDDLPEPCCVVCRQSQPWAYGVHAVEEGMRGCCEALHVNWQPTGNGCEGCET